MIWPPGVAGGQGLLGQIRLFRLRNDVCGSVCTRSFSARSKGPDRVAGLRGNEQRVRAVDGSSAMQAGTSKGGAGIGRISTRCEETWLRDPSVRDASDRHK